MTDQEQYAGTMPVAEKQRFDIAQLEAYMRDHVEGFSGHVEIEQFKGGQSNPTFLLKVDGHKKYVLRRKPVTPASFLAEVNPGDYVVHQEHGIGRFEGLVRLSTTGVEREYLLIRYAGSFVSTAPS